MHLLLPALVAGVGVALPLAYLLVRAGQSDPATLADRLLNWHNVQLLINTLGLTAAVLVTVTVLALPVAWLTARTDVRWRSAITVLMVLPLTIPPYLMAYALRAAGGRSGAAAALLGFELPVVSGFWGALIALSLFNFPYMYLNLRAALARIDPSLEDAARSLGDRPMRVFFRVVMPQLRPAISAGGLLVAMRVLGDFGVVSLMRFHTFSYKLYIEYKVAFDRVYAACLAIILLLLTGLLLYLDMRFLRGLRLHATTGTTRRRQPRVRLGRFGWLGYGVVILIALAGVVAPIGTILYWFFEGLSPKLISDFWAATQSWLGFADAAPQVIDPLKWEPNVGRQLFEATVNSLGAALPAALFATFLAVPVAYLSQRYPSRLSRGVERMAYLGYATPCLAFALGVIFFSLMLKQIAGLGWIYQSLFLLVYAYSLHFLAEALGPIRSCLTLATPRLEESSRALGENAWTTFHRVTLPLLKSGLVGSTALVFLSAMKELPLTFLLAPPDFETLSVSAWSYSDNAMFAEAAPFAVVILLASSLLVALLLYFGREIA